MNRPPFLIPPPRFEWRRLVRFVFWCGMVYAFVVAVCLLGGGPQ